MIKRRINDPRGLAAGLRKVAKMWRPKTKRSGFGSGICYAMFTLWETEDTGCAYKIIDALLEMTEAGWVAGRAGYLSNMAGQVGFEQRATMCLFLAEWLDTDYVQ